ncbi:hypothetical protein C8J57DRAFT_1472178 [Mycena rebaudengoi]|nr:hypothetical protein C8J57DRAFT_1472178 [Mycena rebaudengoi]
MPVKIVPRCMIMARPQRHTQYKIDSTTTDSGEKKHRARDKDVPEHAGALCQIFSGANAIRCPALTFAAIAVKRPSHVSKSGPYPSRNIHRHGHTPTYGHAYLPARSHPRGARKVDCGGSCGICCDEREEALGGGGNPWGAKRRQGILGPARGFENRISALMDWTMSMLNLELKLGVAVFLVWGGLRECAGLGATCAVAVELSERAASPNVATGYGGTRFGGQGQHQREPQEVSERRARAREYSVISTGLGASSGITGQGYNCPHGAPHPRQTSERRASHDKPAYRVERAPHRPCAGGPPSVSQTHHAPPARGTLSGADRAATRRYRQRCEGIREGG